MKRLFVCCDGTWNAPTDVQDGVPVPTNVFRFHNALGTADLNGNEQRAYYHPGVGVGVDVVDRAIDGVTGRGLGRNVMSAFKWLSDNYRRGDKLYLVGFSRGAFTVRSLSGLISRCGLPTNLSWDDVERAFGIYRMPPDDADMQRQLTAFHAEHPFDPDLGLEFIGVWDTVGSLGIPRDLDWLGIEAHRYQFHNTALSPLVRNARQALAIDEMRANFTPTLWTGTPASSQTVKQEWFPGVHSDVGGGYKECGLSNGAFLWMVSEAKSIGVTFRDQMLTQVQPNSRGVLHDSLRGAFLLANCQPRSFPCIIANGVGPCGQLIHDSTIDRYRDPPIEQAPYRSTKLLSVQGSVDLSVYARDYWNWTGVYLAQGDEYEFRATGEWEDGHHTVGSAGDAGNPIQWLASTAKRVRDAPWFCLIGAIGDAGNPDNSGNPSPMTLFRIGDKCRHTVRKGGYLYCFANDAINPVGPKEFFYRNNRGSVTVTITRLA